MRVAAWGATDPGRRRSRNEDAFGILETEGLLLVADGMGGHRGGSVASRMAVDGVLAAFRGNNGDHAAALDCLRADRRRVGTTEPMIKLDAIPEDTPRVSGAPAEGGPPAYSAGLALLQVAIRQTGAAIYLASRADGDLQGMGTTLTAVLIDGGRAHVAHAGDSRCYLWRASALRQLTRDHSWIAEQVRVGAITETEAKQSRFRHVITRSLGFERHVDIEVRSVSVASDDRLLLCSDGLFGMVTDEELNELMSLDELDEIPGRMIALANERGGEDNITAVVARLRAVQPPAE
ncbi:MAG: PP2C family serine/threonine-protein phosphatase [Kofleriaceae bacterium]